MEREVGGGIGIGNTCKPMAVSFQCMTKSTTKKKKRILEWVAIPSPGDLRNPGVNPGSPALQADSLLSEPPEKPRVGPFSNAIVYTHSVSDPSHPHHCLPHLHLCHLSTAQFLRPCHLFCILIAKIMIKARLYRGLILEEN